MITYNRSAFGLSLIFQLHGSAVYRAVVPSLISVGIYFLWRNFYNASNVIVMKEDLGHPYAVGALVASASFLVVFRANQGYARYWEACGAVHHFMSKWMDATTHAGVYHLQCDHYKDIQPPSFFEYPELNNLYLTRDRERGVTYDEEEEAELLAEVKNKDNNNNNNNNKDGNNANGHDDEDGSKISRNESSLHQFKHKHGNKNISSNSTRTKQQQQQALREQLKRKTGAAHRKTVLHQEKEKRRAQAVVKSINYVAPPPPPAKKKNPKSPTAHSTTTSTSVSSISRRIKAVTSQLSSDSSLPPLEQDHIIIIEQPDFPLRGINRRTQSADDIDRLETTIEESSQQNNNNKNNNKTTKSKSKSKNNNHLSREFFELLQKEVAEASPPFSQPGKGKPYPLWGRPRLDGNWGAWYTQDEKTPLATFAATTATTAAAAARAPNGDNQDEDDDDQEQEEEDIDVANGNGKLPPEGFASIQGGRTPSLYLQELVHLSSLLVAVALATLRNDIDGSESPLAFYDPGSDWPAVDPDKDDWMKVSSGMSHLQKSFLYFLGMGRSPEEQTRYNAGRPLPVVGGVSDGEIRFLQMAKGPYAKTMLCWNWLSEFMIREHIAGSMGKVAPPIVSRCFQFLGDGMIHYNHARKVMFIPYPFVHAQLSVLFIVVMIPVIPFLMDQYTDEAWLGAALSFFTILCLAGVNEVAREMENPFRNVPNEVPLVTFMAQYNEALITVYSGYHPDSFWNGQAILKQRQQHQQQQQQKQQQEEAERRNRNDTTGISTNGGSPSPPTTRRQQEREDSRITISTDQSADDLSLSGWAGADQQQHNKDEVALLKEQVAKQAALIEQLFAQMGSSSSPSKQQQKGAIEEVEEEESTIVC